MFTVSQINSYIRALLDGDEILNQILVQGEISNFKHHSSGHMYFTLKDKQSSIRAVMFRSRARWLRFNPQDGMNVVVQGNVSVYERDGQYQLYVNSLQPLGQGALYKAFEELKQKLEKEGLFAAERKLPLPFWPHTIGIATSPTGAAVQDLISLIMQRNPRARILLAPILVQGAEAPTSIVQALARLCAVPEVDVIILGRGGGSIEELWAFNDEQVARAIAACSKPVISAVGHETDFTIADFVADWRSPTPSAAAEAVVPVLSELEHHLTVMETRLEKALQNVALRQSHRLQEMTGRLALHNPRRTLERLAQTLDTWEERLTQAIGGKLAWETSRVQDHATNLQALSPLSVLARGYSVVLNQEGETIRAAAQVAAGDVLQIIVEHGRITSQVIATGGMNDDTSI